MFLSIYFILYDVIMISKPSVRPLISPSAPLSNSSRFDSNIAYFLFLIVASVFPLVALVSFKDPPILPTFPSVQKVKPRQYYIDKRVEERIPKVSYEEI